MRTCSLLLLASVASVARAQSIDIWNTGPWNTGTFFNGINLSGPPGLGAIVGSLSAPFDPPVPTPYGPLWLAPPLVTIDAGAIPPGGAFTTWLTIPADPALLDLRVAFQGAVLPAASPSTLVLGDACTRRVGPMAGIGPLTPFSAELFGRSLATGDRDGDGDAELAVGAPGGWNFAGTVAGVGHAGVYGGSPLSLLQTLSGTQGNANFGNSVAMAQVDGFAGPDLIVGEPRYDLSPTQVDFGRVHVFWAPSYTTSTVIAFPALAGGGPLQFFGFEVLGANLGGASASVVVGAPALGSTPSRVHVFSYSSPATLTLGYSLLNPAGTAGDFGRALAVGNVATASPVAELVVGDRSFAATGYNRGRVYVYTGTALLGFVDSPTPADGGGFGSALATGDFTGDGVADLAVGAPGEGKVYVYAGAASGPFGAPIVLQYPGPYVATGFGTALVAGDANGDGALDLIVGYLPAGGVGEAIVFVGTPGAANTFELRASLQDQDGTANLYGTAFAIGDTDGDLVPEVFGGAPVKTVGFLTPGRVFVGRL